jgi:hypothetical protein
MSGLKPKNEETSQDADDDLFDDIDELLADHSAEYPLNCTAEEFAKLTPGTHEYLVKEADCGTGYPYDDSKRSEQKPVHVVLFGESLKENYQLSGCSIGQRCPHHPKCTTTLTANLHDEVLGLADVVLVGTEDADLMARVAAKSKKSTVRKVLYWREAYWPHVMPQQQKNQFDLGMGVHFMSGIVNPNYLRRPRTLVAKSFFEFLPFKQRTEFALSIISNCAANSERQTYIGHLTDYLGSERIHQYGACGNRKLPPAPIKNAAKVIAKYKFYLSFENTIQHGYVSEKLFTVLNMQLLPVYMGAMNVPNITKVPSFIKAHDYNSPKELAEYLLYLDSHPEAYARYHLWRKDTSLFTEDYLELVKRKFPGQQELRFYKSGKGVLRTAGCCRLCNLPFLDEEIAKRTDKDLVQHILSKEQIDKEFFGGSLHHRPGQKARLDHPILKMEGSA